MKRLVLLTSFTLIYLVSQAQVIDYVIDPTFNSGDLYMYGKVWDFMLTNEGTIFVTGMFDDNVFSDGHAGSFTLISYDGQALVNEGNQFQGSHVITKYKSKFFIGNSLFNVNILGINRDYSFDFEFGESAYIGWPGCLVTDFSITPEENILVAGSFLTDSTLIDTPLHLFALHQLCLVDSNGASIPSFPNIRCTEPIYPIIETIDTLSTGEYIIGGDFSEVEGHPYADFAKLNSDFSVNTNFAHTFTDESGSVRVVYIDSEDRIWAVFYGEQIIGHPNYPSPLVRLLPDGTVDESYQPIEFTSYYGHDINNPTSPFDTYPHAILEDTDSTFIMGGNFIEVNGESHKGLIKIHENGEIIEGAFGGMGPDEAVWGDWFQYGLSSIADMGIFHILKLPDGKLLIGGQFSSFGGVPYNCMVRLKPSGYVGIDETSAHKALKIYPNPAKDFIRIDVPGANAYRQEVRIFDLSGRLVLSASAVESQGKIGIENLSTGLYVLRVLRDSGVFTGKFLVD